jgi:translocation and assembly module TamA
MPPTLLSQKHPRFLLCLLTLSCGGCSLTDILTGTPTAYSFTHNQDDRATNEYLQKILDERVSEKTKTLSDEPETRVRQEQYMEQEINGDLLKALYAKGYYAARIQYVDSAQPFSGAYDIQYGPQFTISDVTVTPDLYAGKLDTGLLAADMPLEADRVLAAQSVLMRNIQKDRCYFSLNVQNEVYLDQPRHQGKVNFAVDAGKEGNFGKISFSGNTSVKDSYLRKLVTWREGNCFRREKLEDFKTALLQSGLFSRAEIVLPEEPSADGSVPVMIDLRERAHRSISAGLTYYSDEGLGALLGWEHRNFFGSAEKVKAALSLSMLNQSLELNFDKPYFIRKDQNLSFNTVLERQDTDAYEETGLKGGVALTRNFTRKLTGSTGVDLTLTRIDDKTDDSTKTYGLISFPQSVTYDSRDDKLDPHKGWNLSGTAKPFFDVLGESAPFFKTQVTGSAYLSLGQSVVLASKLGMGNIWGTSIEDVPATERFYAGGGGSVRGFGYQEVGPKKDGDPTGGSSLVNFSFELRSKFTSKFGGVAFVDGASVTEESAPEFKNIAIGAGIGVRYYTDFGPLRFDLATPLTQKDDVDQNYQIYISIGQAF